MSHTHTMRQRLPAQSVMEVLFLEQDLVQPRSWLGRVVGRSPLGAHSEPWFQAAQGELAVARLLADLPWQWTVFHALPRTVLDRGVDHLLVGPAGIFAITTRTHVGQKVLVAHRVMLVGNVKKSYIRDAEFDALRLTRVLRDLTPLRASVRPVVVCVKTRSITVRERPAQVKVLGATDLRRWLLDLPPLLGPDERRALVLLIDDPEIWDAQPGIEPDALRERYLRLTDEVSGARRRRREWGGAGMALVLAGLALPFLPTWPLGPSVLEILRAVMP
ncbi:MAG: nuclease-related domain-containing protein [Cryobacterium sp.]